jgi:hypothetical protein
MDKDNIAVRNQKVFVSLSGYTRVATEYNRVVDELNTQLEASKQAAAAGALVPPLANNIDKLRHRKIALEFVIDNLSLPIEKRLERNR